MNDWTAPPPADCPDESTASDLLLRGAIVECKLVPWGSNYTFAVVLRDPNGERDDEVAIYKPRAGETPLWDFPDGTLYKREYAAYVLSQVLGWNFIPETVVRNGPHGVGTVQRYIEPEANVHYFTIRDELAQHRAELQRVALFDLAANNADRKAGHCFRGSDGRIWGIDHGLTFNAQPKLRTVIWEFCGEPIADDLREQLAGIATDNDLATRLRPYLDPLEIAALRGRARRLAEAGVYPDLNPRRNIPYGW